MGKKDKRKTKGKGAEKTAAKTEKKLCQKLKKKLANLGEDDIEKMVKEFEVEGKKKVKVVETVVPEPSRRVNFSFISHPDKDQLFMFGGELFDGKKTQVYNDLFCYNIPKNEWRSINAPGAPPPRCSHQMVALSTDKGQLWVFAGEFSSASESQFYHYKDLWVYRIADKKWDKIEAKDMPPARSGHRMICVKKHLIVFGGYYDNLRECKYFNDVHIFNLETYTWKKIEPIGLGPCPRSGCQMVALPDGRILISGGYSKHNLKKDVDKGVVHNDSFTLTPDKTDFENGKWKWNRIKFIGVKITPRSSFPICSAPPHFAYAFGGVTDEDKEEEEDLDSIFYNDMYVLDLESLTWRTVTVSEKNKTKPPQEMEIAKLEEEEEVVADDGIFKVTMGPSSKSSTSQSTSNDDLFVPQPRMSCGMAVKHGVLYLYGGIFEQNDIQYTLSDFYSLDLKKLNQWKTIIKDDLHNHVWFKEESSSGSDSSDSDTDMSEEEDEDEEME